MRLACILGVASLSLALAGCTSPQEEAQQRAARAAQRQAFDQSKCQSYGFQPGTTEFANCMMSLDQQRAAARAAIGAAMMPGLMNNPGLLAPPPAPARPVNTNCVVNGQFVNCFSQ